MRVTQLFKEFFSSESLGGLLLVAATGVALVVANSPAGASYAALLHTHLAGKTLEFWVNDGLMSFFFLLVGLEIERELYVGELSNRRTALLPVSAAIGGMLVPMLLFSVLNRGKPGLAGFGIPMATDIAFALGILSLLGSRVPYTLKVFLTALAIIDDMGAILIISLFYTQGFSAWALGGAAGAFGLMLLLNRMRVHALWPYFVLAVGLWAGLYQAGIHPTVTGILLAFAIPFGDGGKQSPSYRLQHALHGPVAYFIMPVFALTNAGILFSSETLGTALGSALGAGILLGLVVGKPVGIMLFSELAVRASIADRLEGVHKRHLWGASALAGIGFTMSIFITLLAFEDAESVWIAKIAVLAASALAALIGVLILLKRK